MTDPMTPTVEQAACLFHETYERLAPEYGYETRQDTKDFDPNSANGRLMIAVCAEILPNLLAPAVGREQIARVIDPDDWSRQDAGERTVDIRASLAKAEAILALLSRTGEG